MTRVQDFALIVGHVWRCTSCREALLERPETVWMGYKLSEDQRQRVLKLSDDSFQSMARLAEATGLTVREIEGAIEHPRARLRHLGSVKGDYHFRPNGGRPDQE
jgi:hypothetical protein